MSNDYDVILLAPARQVITRHSLRALGFKTACINKMRDKENKPVLGGTCLDGDIPQRRS